jgi:hypothetical protein
MAYSESQPTVSIVAATTFAATDLYKFVELTTDAQVTIGATTSGHIVGTLLSVTGTTAGGGVETVTVGLLSGVGKVFMAGTTRDAGQTVAASSAGFGIAPTTDQAAYGISLSGSSGTTGRIHSVLFQPSRNL